VPEKQVVPANTDDDIELEEQIHDYDKMVAMSIIEAEMELMQEFIKKSKSGDEKAFFSEKLSSLEYAKSTIESNIQIGIITPDKYLSNIKNYLKEQ
jgi:type III secretory pathway component EscR